MKKCPRTHHTGHLEETAPWLWADQATALKEGRSEKQAW